MRKLFRITVYVLLFALLVSLGDGPFVDEFMAEENQQQQQVVAESASDQISAAPGSLTCVYHTLLNFLDSASCPRFDAPVAHNHVIPFEAQAFVSRLVAPLDKPPRTLS